MSCVDDGDTAWVQMASVLVLGMIPGLALYEAGLGPNKHGLSIMVQIISGVTLLSVMWILFGFSFVYGSSLGGFIGSPTSFPLLMDLIGANKDECLPFAPQLPGHVFAVFQMMFAAITPLLQTGAFLGRMKFKVFLIYIFFWELLVYYPVAHWIWGSGFLSANGTGLPFGDAVIDFAGGITIHLTSGIAALISVIMLGRRRLGEHETHEHARPANFSIALVGCIFLWVGWFGFNAGSALTAGIESSITVANTQLAASVSGFTWLILEGIHTKKSSLIQLFNGIVAGLAGITPCAGFVTPQWALLISLILGVSSYYGRNLFLRLHIDDAQEVCIVHGLTGIIGAFMNGFFASKDISPNGQNGWVNGNPIQIAYQILGIVIAAAWSGFWTFLILKLLDWTLTIRVDPEVEDIGLGYGEHGEYMDEFGYYATRAQQDGDVNQFSHILNSAH